MNNFYLYKFSYSKKEKGNDKIVSASVIFCDKETINEDYLKSEIKRFYEQNYQTDEIFIIGSSNIKERLKQVFIERQDKTFIGIPKKQETHLSDSLYLLTFDKVGKLKCENGKKIPQGFLKNYLNEGLQNIFIKRGGLITSQGAHHFVFPSGKHCDRFLRTGNILLIGSEIYFIAFSLLRHFDEAKHDQIYCDTSSINSVAFALSELKNRFVKPENRKQISIESFSSYEGLYKNELSYSENAFLIISASTSSNILAYIKNSHRMLDIKNIVVLYYLGEQQNYLNIEDNVLCNLTQSKVNPNGIAFYPTFKSDNCDHCKKGSYPVEVLGDVFLLEKPKINKVVLKVSDPEKYLSDLLKQFKSVKRNQNVFKVNYKETYNSNLKYEVYINYYEILEGIKKGLYGDYKRKLDAYINQYVPSNTKYLITLNDVASDKLADYIIEKIKVNYKQSSLPKKITQDDLIKIKSTTEGTALVVGSCIANGKNLLFVSRALRKFDALRIVYFIGISRTKNKEYLNFLKSNLKQGSYGAESSSFVEIENIFCNNDASNTSWLSEISFLKRFTEYVKDEHPKFKDLSFLFERKKLLETSTGDSKRGLANELFYPRLKKGNQKEELIIRKNFAFFNFDNYVDEVSQADIYFTISNIINSLRNSNGNSDKLDRTLKQSVYIRSLLDPANYSRFNDGIIQASILRAAYPEELNYGIDLEVSQEMANTLETIIKYCQDEQGEALLEFLYAIAIKKMTLAKVHLEKIIKLLKDRKEEDLIKCFAIYIDKNILNPKEITLTTMGLIKTEKHRTKI
jgi:hypothetical protein